jgi:hypothetical protein
MSANRDQIHHLVDRLPDAELPAAQRFLEFLSQEPVGPMFAGSIQRGIEQADSGQTIVCRDYNEMVEKLLGQE